MEISVINIPQFTFTLLLTDVENGLKYAKKRKKWGEMLNLLNHPVNFLPVETYFW